MTDGFQHITTPRRTWKEARKERANACPTLDGRPPVLEPVEDAPPRTKVDGYVAVYRESRNSYCFRFWYEKRTHAQGGFRTAEAAAWAYNNYVTAHGLARALNFEREEQTV